MCKSILLFALVVCAPALLLAQRRPIDHLPRPYECGFLREDQFFNLQRNVKPDELTWMARIIYKDSPKERCMGVLIHQQYLLFTAQCLDSNHSSPVEAIELGACLTEEADCVTVEKFEVITHYNYKSDAKDMTSNEHDIALLRLEQPIKFTRYVSPICLPTADDTNTDYVGQHLTVTGQWTTGKRAKKFFTIVQSLAQCRKHFEAVSPRFLCANICDNESTFSWGSALLDVRMKNLQVDHYYLVGINTLSDGKSCDDLSPDIFLRIDRHVKWIVDTIYEHETKSNSL